MARVPKCVINLSFVVTTQLVMTKLAKRRLANVIPGSLTQNLERFSGSTIVPHNVAVANSRALKVLVAISSVGAAKNRANVNVNLVMKHVVASPANCRVSMLAFVEL